MRVAVTRPHALLLAGLLLVATLAALLFGCDAGFSSVSGASITPVPPLTTAH